MFTLNQIALAPTRNPYRVGLLFCDFGANLRRADPPMNRNMSDTVSATSSSHCESGCIRTIAERSEDWNPLRRK